MARRMLPSSAEVRQRISRSVFTGWTLTNRICGAPSGRCGSGRHWYAHVPRFDEGEKVNAFSFSVTTLSACTRKGSHTQRLVAMLLCSESYWRAASCGGQMLIIIGIKVMCERCDPLASLLQYFLPRIAPHDLMCPPLLIKHLRSPQITHSKPR